MPYTSDKLKIGNEKLDNRVKIRHEQYEEVKALYIELKSLRKVAKIYGVDKATISKIVNADQAERIAEQSKKSSHDYRERLKTDRELKNQRNENMNRHRRHKHMLYQDGKIKKTDNESNDKKDT